MSDLRTLPTIIAHAEAEARVRQDGLANRWPSIEDCPPPTWASMAPAERQFLIDVELDLACDISRPASMDAVARLVAERIGFVCGTTAPEFKRTVGGDGWLFRAGWGAPEVEFVEGVRKWTTFNPIRPTDFFLAASLDGIGTITDPAEALRLIALYVLREPA